MNDVDLSGCDASPPPEDEVPSEGCVKSCLLLFLWQQRIFQLQSVPELRASDSGGWLQHRRSQLVIMCADRPTEPGLDQVSEGENSTLWHFSSL